MAKRIHFDVAACTSSGTDSVEYCVLELTNGSRDAAFRKRSIDYTATEAGSALAAYDKTITMPHSYTGATVTIALLSDPHIGQNGLAVAPAATLAMVVADINTNVSPDYVFWLGDNCFTDHAENAAAAATDYDTLLTLAAQITGVTSHHWVRGNHDDRFGECNAKLGLTANDGCSTLTLGNLSIVFLSITTYESSTISAEAQGYLDTAIDALGATDNMFLCSHQGIKDTTRTTDVDPVYYLDPYADIASSMDGLTACAAHFNGHGHVIAMSVANTIVEVDIDMPYAAKPTQWSPGLLAGHELATGLSFAYPLWEGTGNAVDVKNSIIGTVTNATWQTDATLGSVVRFVGGTHDDHITVPNHASFQALNDFSVVALVKPDVTDAKSRIFYSYDAGSTEWFFLTQVTDGSGLWNFRTSVGGTGVNSDAAPSGAWELVIGTRAAGILRLYVDGVLQSDSDDDGGAEVNLPTADIYIGADLGLNNEYNGDLAMFELYGSKALSQAEVTQKTADVWGMFWQARGKVGHNLAHGTALVNGGLTR